MHKVEYLLLFLNLLISLAFRIYISSFIQIRQQISLPVIFIGLVNIILIFIIIRRLINIKIALLATMLYAISPWTAYLELASSPYIVLLSLLLVLYAVFEKFNIKKKFFLILLVVIIAVFIYRFDGFTIFSNIGLINTVNSFRGETNQTIFAPLGKIIENRYIYLSEHLLFNILKQFAPATYFTPQVHLLGFSASPPIYLGFIIPFVFGLLRWIRLFSREITFGALIVLLLMFPSILSKNSPDLPSLIIVSPVIFYLISVGAYEIILNYKKRIFRYLLFLTVLMVAVQFFVTLSDIAIREPVRMQESLNQK